MKTRAKRKKEKKKQHYQGNDRDYIFFEKSKRLLQEKAVESELMVNEEKGKRKTILGELRKIALCRGFGRHILLLTYYPLDQS